MLAEMAVKDQAAFADLAGKVKQAVNSQPPPAKSQQPTVNG